MTDFLYTSKPSIKASNNHKFCDDEGQLKRYMNNPQQDTRIIIEKSGRNKPQQ